jgi:hypothetical protein
MAGLKPFKKLSQGDHGTVFKSDHVYEVIL